MEPSPLLQARYLLQNSIPVRPPGFKGLLEVQEQCLGLARLVPIPAKPGNEKRLGSDTPFARDNVTVGLSEVRSFDR